MIKAKKGYYLSQEQIDTFFENEEMVVTEGNGYGTGDAYSQFEPFEVELICSESGEYVLVTFKEREHKKLFQLI